MNKMKKAGSWLIAASLLFAGTIPINALSTPVYAAAQGTSYYVDSNNGNDSQSGTSASQAWKSLGKVNSMAFQPGDRILFKSGGSWNGHLSPQGSGTAGSPIVVDRYDSGNKPVINGKGLTEGTIMLQNQEYWEISNLEITNDDDLSVNYTGPDRRIGVLYSIDGRISDRVYEHIYIQNCYIHDVDGNEHGISTDPYKSSGGIVGEVIVGTKGSVKKARFNDLRITGNTIEHVDRTGIKPVRYKLLYVPVQTGGQYDSEVGPLLRDNNLWSTKVYIGQNKLTDIGGDGILIRDTKGALIEHNVLAGFAMRSNKPNAGMWPWNAVDTTFQFNEVSGGARNQDGTAFDLDSMSTNTTFQFNYSHDNPEGFMLVMAGNDHDVVRYNISQNDGRLFKYFLFNELSPSYIMNNIFYYDSSKFEMTNEVWKNGFGVYNNVFYNTNKSKPTNWGVSDWSKADFSHNVFYEAGGIHAANEPSDPNKITQDPLFVNPGSGTTGINSLDGYKLKPTSPLINAGKLLIDGGVKDFWGTALHYDRPDIGAYEYPVGIFTPVPTTPGVDPLAIPQSQMTATATSAQPGEGAARVLDGNKTTLWSTKWDLTDRLPQSLTIQLNEPQKINKFVYTPRQDLSGDGRFNGIITKYKLSVSSNGQQFTEVSQGDWVRDKTDKVVTFSPVTASFVKLEALEGSGGWATAAEINLYKAPSLTAAPAAVLSGPSSVDAEQLFHVSYGLKNIKNAVYAQDIQLRFNPQALEFVSASSSSEGIGVIDQNADVAGQLRLILASKGEKHGVSGDAGVLDLVFKPKKVTQSVQEKLEITKALMGDEEGSETDVELPAMSIEIKPGDPGNPGMPNDVNHDGKVTIGDLAIVAAHYGKTKDSPDWNTIKSADVTGNGIIDIEDLVRVAKQITE